MIEFKLPDIGEGLSEAELLEWTIAVGDTVREGDEVAVISTDKVNVELAAPATGRIAALFGAPGDVIEVGTLIMEIEALDSQSSPEPAALEPAALDRAEQQPGTPPEPLPAEAAPVVTSVSAKPVKAAPMVRKYAAEQGIDLATIEGTGPGGQVLHKDVEARIGAVKSADKLPAGASGSIKLSGGRLAAARNLTQANRTAVMTTIQFDVHADGIIRRSRREEGITPTAVVAHCLVGALRLHPHFNAVISEAGDELLMYDDVHLGVAVSTDDGLIVPVISRVQEMGLAEIAAAISALAEQARVGALAVEILKNSTFTLSSTGSLESATITGTTPVLNWPNAAILWVSRISDRPRVTDGALEAGPVMACSLSFDHRYLHGADGMAFINDFDAACRSCG